MKIDLLLEECTTKVLVDLLEDEPNANYWRELGEGKKHLAKLHREMEAREMYTLERRATLS